MIPSVRLFALALAFAGTVAGKPAGAADFTFQFQNETRHTLAMKLFSRGESLRQWPSRTRAYSVKPENGVQELKIDCEEGEQICWGAWVGVQGGSGTVGGSHQRGGASNKQVAGAGDRGMEGCTGCCHVCKAGGKAPVATLSDGDFVAR